MAPPVYNVIPDAGPNRVKLQPISPSISYAVTRFLFLYLLTNFQVRYKNELYIILKPDCDSIQIRKENGKRFIHSVSKLIRMKEGLFHSQ